jgi:iron(II)-dependent oxidoreductase
LPPVSQQLRSEQSHGDLREALVARLERVRARTLALIAPLSEDALNRVHDPLMSPIVWDLGHMAAFEDLWLVQTAFGKPALRDELGKVYDPNAAPRSKRGALPYLRSDDCRGYLEAVRQRTLECLAEADLSQDSDRLLAGGFVYELTLRHEMQHSETILQTLQLMTSEPYETSSDSRLGANIGSSDEAIGAGSMVLVPAGEFVMGTDRLVFSYDNERPAQRLRLDEFMIDRTPVTNGAYAEFIEAGGYERPELWSSDGQLWLSESGSRLPRYWRRGSSGFEVRSFSSWEALDPLRPVCHVSWYEADAYARFAGKRLPTESEWERAASWDAEAGAKRRYPWGNEIAGERDANLDQLGFGTMPVGSHPDGASPCGALGMLGDVWEWTASGFDGYPGFEAYPYPEYSQDFFSGPYRVLRGGAWATRAEAVTNTFRNWDYPQRSQIFAGFRCACNVDRESET